jgi:hypothetical protein
MAGYFAGNRRVTQPMAEEATAETVMCLSFWLPFQNVGRNAQSCDTLDQALARKVTCFQDRVSP